VLVQSKDQYALRVNAEDGGLPRFWVDTRDADPSVVMTNKVKLLPTADASDFAWESDGTNGLTVFKTSTWIDGADNANKFRIRDSDNAEVFRVDTSNGKTYISDLEVGDITLDLNNVDITGSVEITGTNRSDKFVVYNADTIDRFRVDTSAGMTTIKGDMRIADANNAALFRAFMTGGGRFEMYRGLGMYGSVDGDPPYALHSRNGSSYHVESEPWLKIDNSTTTLSCTGTTLLSGPTDPSKFEVRTSNGDRVFTVNTLTNTLSGVGVAKIQPQVILINISGQTITAQNTEGSPNETSALWDAYFEYTYTLPEGVLLENVTDVSLEGTFTATTFGTITQKNIFRAGLNEISRVVNGDGDQLSDIYWFQWRLQYDPDRLILTFPVGFALTDDTVPNKFITYTSLDKPATGSTSTLRAPSDSPRQFDGVRMRIYQSLHQI
jgi:hypothetical protein